LTLRQMQAEAPSDHSDAMSLLSDEDPNFQNIFAQPTANPGPGTSKQTRPDRAGARKDTVPHHALPKMHFPQFDGSQPRIWIDKCENYFDIYSIPTNLQVTAATMHLQDNAAKWWQAYKQNHQIPSWKKFCEIVQDKFGADDFKNAIFDLLNLKQTGTVEDYTKAFRALQFELTMHNSHYDELFFATNYVEGLRDDIKATVEPHVPVTVDRAVVIAKIQQRTLERNKSKSNKNPIPRFQNKKIEAQLNTSTVNLQRIRQLRDYRRANNLCYSCGEKYEPGHADICPKKQKSQINALVVNDLDKTEITEDMPNQLAVEDALTEDFGQLSLNALSSLETQNSIKLKAMVKDKVMRLRKLSQLC